MALAAAKEGDLGAVQKILADGGALDVVDKGCVCGVSCTIYASSDNRFAFFYRPGRTASTWQSGTISVDDVYLSS